MLSLHVKAVTENLCYGYTYVDVPNQDHESESKFDNRDHQYFSQLL